ncbi:MAG TPA: FecR domain-containing protein [Steroidobacteraceae bacterium]|nr:FecR domain-containing protein [Steroidobacteraceae bacterium]
MSEVVKLRTRTEIEEEAAAWLWRLEDPDAVGAEREAFALWLRQDPRHRRALDELSRTWEALDGLAESKQGESTNSAAEVVGSAARRDRRPLWFAAAVALVTALVGGVTWLRQGSETQTLATAVGQHRNVVLADGTAVTLNTNSIVETALGRRVREIYLRKGEAHFDVAHDASRPFLVHAGDAVVRAIGTGFDVRVRADQHIDVLVTEGRVEVQADTPTPAAAGGAVAVVTVRAVSAGERLSTAKNAVVPVSAEQVSSEQAWREGAVVFDSEPLSEAIAEIQRYTDSRIIISDQHIATLPVGGRFKTDDLQGFLDGLEAALPVTIRRTSDGLVYIDPSH